MRCSYLKSNPLLRSINRVHLTIEELKEKVKAYYLNILSLRYSCPKCSRQINLSGLSQVFCICGLSFDPTIEFQKSSCCSARLLKKTLHYVCFHCGKITPSIFIFDEKLFDAQYFKEKMQSFREKQRKRKQELLELLKVAKSGSLYLTEDIYLDTIPGLIQDLDNLAGDRRNEEEFFDLNQGLSFQEYRNHILNELDTELMFNSFTSLSFEERKDKIYRFITLIFMEQEREVILHQYGNDVLVEKI